MIDFRTVLFKPHHNPRPREHVPPEDPMTYTLPKPPPPLKSLADHVFEFEPIIRNACAAYTAGTRPAVVTMPAEARRMEDPGEFWRLVEQSMKGTGWALRPTDMRDGGASRHVVPE